MSRERLLTVFQRVMDAPPDQREAVLTAETGNDPQLLAEVRRLLASDAAAQSASFLSEPALETEARAAHADPKGTWFRRYRIESRIGEGGMGEVYRAYDSELNRTVALKTIRGWFGSDELLRRFYNEHQLLAQLNHENIARLHDAGIAEGDRPFLVMEFIDGVPIDQFVTNRGLGSGEIVDLVCRVSSAVAYAHQKLIVHRDLKPSNILVTADGIPKLLDFGIAKLIGGDSATLPSGGLTPEYASPEQILGKAVTTSTDVYSLGVLLYELLTGRRPYGKVEGPLELSNAICNREPEPLSSNGRRFDADLETILQMALRKEPERRYASVEQFTADLSRWKRGYPVVAQLDSRRYRAAKFIKRNRSSLIAAGVAVTVLVGGTTAVVLEAQVANQRFMEVRKLAASLTTEIEPAIRDLAGATPARKLITARALEYLDRLSQGAGSDRGLAREIANAYVKVGEVQGTGHANLGDAPGARDAFRKAVALLEPLVAQSPDDVAIGDELGRAYLRLEDLEVHTGSLAASSTVSQKLVSLYEKISAAKPQDAHVLEGLSQAYVLLADLTGNPDVPNLGDPKGALRWFQKALEASERVRQLDPGNVNNRSNFPAIYGRIGSVERMLDDRTTAADAFRHAIGLEKEWMQTDPSNVRPMREAAIYGRTLALVLNQDGKVDQALSEGTESHSLFSQLAAVDPTNQQAQVELGDSFTTQGKFLLDAGKAQQARDANQSALAIYRKAASQGNQPATLGLRLALQVGADIALKAGDAQTAIDDSNEELKIAELLLRGDPKMVNAHNYQGIAFRDLGKAHELLASHATGTRRASEWQAALSWHRRSLEIWTNLKQMNKLLPAYAGQLGKEQEAIERCLREK